VSPDARVPKQEASRLLARRIARRPRWGRGRREVDRDGTTRPGDRDPGRVPAFVALAMSALVVLSGCSVSSDLTAERCPASRRLKPGNADRIDFVHVDGITYYNYASLGQSAGRALRERDLGTQVAVVRCQLADHNIDGPHEHFDGDAAFLPKASPLYAVRGYRPAFRLAARRDGELVLFEAADNPKARTWADLLDIRGKVRRIRISGPDDVARSAGMITKPRQVARLVDLLLQTPTGKAQRCGDGPAYFLAFQLHDATATVRSYSVHARRLECRDPLPEAFDAAVRAALR
jgi:hypothetical protein